jgi:hypothetical protein
VRFRAPLHTVSLPFSESQLKEEELEKIFLWFVPRKGEFNIKTVQYRNKWVLSAGLIFSKLVPESVLIND